MNSKITELNANRQVMTDLITDATHGGDSVVVPLRKVDLLIDKAYQDGGHKDKNIAFDKSPSRVASAVRDIKLINLCQAAFRPQTPNFIKRNQRTARGNDFYGGEAARAAGGARKLSLAAGITRAVSVGLATGAASFPPLLGVAAAAAIVSQFLTTWSIARLEKGEADGRMLSHSAIISNVLVQQTQAINQTMSLGLSSEQIDAFVLQQTARFVNVMSSGVDVGRLKISALGSLVVLPFLILTPFYGLISAFTSYTGLLTLTAMDSAADVARRAMGVQGVYYHLAAGLSFNQAVQLTNIQLNQKQYSFKPSFLSLEESIEISKLVDQFYYVFFQELTRISPKGKVVNAETVFELLKNNPSVNTNNLEYRKQQYAIRGSGHGVVENIQLNHLNKTGEANDYYQQRFNALKVTQAEIEGQLNVLKWAQKVDPNELLHLTTTQIKALKRNQNELFEEAIHFFKEIGYIDQHVEINLTQAREKGWINALLDSYDTFTTESASPITKVDRVLNRFEVKVRWLLRAIHENKEVSSVSALNHLKFAGSGRFLKRMMRSKNLEVSWSKTQAGELTNVLQNKIREFERRLQNSDTHHQIDSKLWSPQDLSLLDAAANINNKQAIPKRLTYGAKGLGPEDKTPAELEIRRLNQEMRALKRKQNWLIKSENAKLTRFVIHDLLTEPENHLLRPFFQNTSQAYLASSDSSITKPVADSNQVHWTSVSNKLIQTIENQLGQQSGEFISAHDIETLRNNRQLKSLVFDLIQQFPYTNQHILNQASLADREQLMNTLLESLLVKTIDNATQFMGEQLDIIRAPETRKTSLSIRDESLTPKERIFNARLAKAFFQIRYQSQQNGFKPDDYANRIDELFNQFSASLNSDPFAKTVDSQSIPAHSQSTQNLEEITGIKSTGTSEKISPVLVHNYLYKFVGRESNPMSQEQVLQIANLAASASFIETAKLRYAVGNEAVWQQAIAQAQPLLNTFEDPVDNEQAIQKIKLMESQFLEAYVTLRDDNSPGAETYRQLAESVPFVLVSMLRTIRSKPISAEGREEFAQQRAFDLFNKWLERVSQGESASLRFDDIRYHQVVYNRLKREINELGRTHFNLSPNEIASLNTVANTESEPSLQTLAQCWLSACRSKNNPELAQSVPREHIKTLIKWQHLLSPSFTSATQATVATSAAVSKPARVNQAVQINPAFTQYVSYLAASDLPRHEVISHAIQHNNSNNLAQTTLSELSELIPAIAQQPAWKTPELTIQMYQNQPVQARQRQANLFLKLMHRVQHSNRPLHASQLKQLAELSVILCFEAQQQLNKQEQNQPDLRTTKVIQTFTNWTKNTQASNLKITDLIDEIEQDISQEIIANEDQRRQFLLRFQGNQRPSESVQELMIYLRNNPEALVNYEFETNDLGQLDFLEASIRLFKQDLGAHTLDARRQLALKIFDARNNAILNQRADNKLYYPFDDYEVRVKEALIQRYQQNGQVNIAKKLIKNQYELPSLNHLSNNKRRAIASTVQRKTIRLTHLNPFGFNFGVPKKFGSQFVLGNKKDQVVTRSTARSINILIQDGVRNQVVLNERKKWLSELNVLNEENLSLLSKDTQIEANQPDDVDSSDSEATLMQNFEFDLTNLSNDQSDVAPRNFGSNSNSSSRSMRSNHSAISSVTQEFDGLNYDLIKEAIEIGDLDFLKKIPQETRQSLKFFNQVLSNGQTVFNFIQQKGSDDIKNLFNEVEV